MNDTDPQHENTQPVFLCGRLARRPRRKTAFTLIELLVVIAIIALLVSILLPSLSHAKEQARITICKTNMHNLSTGANLFSEDDPDGRYTATSDYGSDNIWPVIPEYADVESACCPSTRNVIRKMPGKKMKVQRLFKNGKFVEEEVETFEYGDVGRNAPKGREDDSGGHSYEVWSWYGAATYPDGEVIDEFELMTNNNIKVPAKTYLFLTADDTGEGDINNWPEDVDNHGEAGFMLGFADGHAEFAAPAEWVKISIESYHPWPAVSQALQAVPNLRNQGGWTGRWWYVSSPK